MGCPRGGGVESAEDAGSSLRRLFDGLTPRLEAARQLEADLDVALARRFNAFDFLDSSELGLSRIVSKLLDVDGPHGQRQLFLKTLLDKLGRPVADIERSRVTVEKTVKEARRIDVVVQLGRDGCLAIENKPYAGDQPKQVHDYLEWLGEQYKENFQLIYLSATGAPPSESSVTLDELKRAGTKDRFKIMAYADAQQWEDEYDDFRLAYSLADWFVDCQRACDVDRLRWFLREAELFCRHRFGGETVTQNERSVLVDFLRERKDHLEIASAIHQCWPEIKEQVVRAYYDVLWRAEDANVDYVDYELWRLDSDYSDAARSGGKCYWSMYKEAWRDHGGSRTSIRLENSLRGPNGWFIGIHSPIALSEDIDRQQRYKKLRECLNTRVAFTETPEDHWPWWIWVEDEYRNWDSIIPALNEENNVRGDITEYFVGKLVTIANAATRLIDEIEAQPD